MPVSLSPEDILPFRSKTALKSGNSLGNSFIIQIYCVRSTGTQYFQAVGELLVESEGFDVDLISIEDSNDRMKEYIKKGKVIYERR